MHGELREERLSAVMQVDEDECSRPERQLIALSS
jgi:hypothetical protein